MSWHRTAGGSYIRRVGNLTYLISRKAFPTIHGVQRMWQALVFEGRERKEEVATCRLLSEAKEAVTRHINADAERIAGVSP